MENLKSTIKYVQTDEAPAAVGTYSQAVTYQGVVYFSGQIGLSPETMQLSDRFEDQLQQVLKNIDALLASQKLTRRNILKTSIFLTNLNNFNSVNKAYENFFEAPYPARSCIEVTALPKGALVEIEVIATEGL